MAYPATVSRGRGLPYRQKCVARAGRPGGFICVVMPCGSKLSLRRTLESKALQTSFAFTYADIRISHEKDC